MTLLAVEVRVALLVIGITVAVLSRRHDLLERVVVGIGAVALGVTVVALLATRSPSIHLTATGWGLIAAAAAFGSLLVGRRAAAAKGNE